MDTGQKHLVCIEVEIEIKIAKCAIHTEPKSVKGKSFYFTKKKKKKKKKSHLNWTFLKQFQSSRAT